MNSINHRQHLRALRARQASTPAQVPTTQPSAPVNVVMTNNLPQDQATTPVVPATANDTPATPTELATLTPTQLRTQARQTAETLAGLPDDEYAKAMESLRLANPTYYAVVADELHNMAGEAAGDEGDGYDMSHIMNPPPQPEDNEAGNLEEPTAGDQTAGDQTAGDQTAGDQTASEVDHVGESFPTTTEQTPGDAGSSLDVTSDN